MGDLRAFLEKRGHAKPGEEGLRTSFGARFYADDDTPRQRLQRKSGQRIAHAKDYEGKRLKDPAKKLEQLSDAERKKLALSDAELKNLKDVQGFHPDHAQNMNFFAKLFNAVLIVRDSNPDTVRFMDDPDYMPKPMECKAKTAKVGDHLGLVVDPTHPVQAKAWDAAIKAAQDAGDAHKAAYLEHHRERALEAWTSYGKKMQEEDGYHVNDVGVIYKPPFKGVHGDYDLHGVFTVDEKGGVTSAVSYGDGSAQNNQDTAGLREQLNSFLRSVSNPVIKLKEMVLHGGQDNWNHVGKTSDPPVTIFLPDALANKLGVETPVKLADAAAMRAFYEGKLGVAWEYSDGRGNYADKLNKKDPSRRAETWSESVARWLDFPISSGKASGKLRSVGAQRWRTNQRTHEDEDWVPVSGWQTYGMFLDILPQLDFLVDPALTRDAVRALPNDRERMAVLRDALLRSDAFLFLCDTWLLSQPSGTARYHGDRRAWRVHTRQEGASAASTAAPAIREKDLLHLEGRAGRVLQQRRAGADGYRARVLADIVALGDTGFSARGRENVALLVEMRSVQDLIDPFAAEASLGTHTAAIEKIGGLLAWMRHAATRMVTDIGVSFTEERSRIWIDGPDAEAVYVRDEARRIALQVEMIAGGAPGPFAAFGRAPFTVNADGEPAAVTSEDHARALQSDLAAALRRSAAPRTAAVPETSSVLPRRRRTSGDAGRLARRVERAARAWNAVAGKRP